MQAGWETTQQELEQVRSQCDNYLTQCNECVVRNGALEEEVRGLKHAKEQMSLNIEALDTALGEAERERDRYKQKWEQSLTPTDAGSSPTALTATKTEAASIVPPLASTPAKKVKARKTRVAGADGGLSLNELAARVGGLTKGAVSNAKQRGPEFFAEYSAKRDPEGIPWRYDEESRRYYPIS